MVLGANNLEFRFRSIIYRSQWYKLDDRAEAKPKKCSCQALSWCLVIVLIDGHWSISLSSILFSYPIGQLRGILLPP